MIKTWSGLSSRLGRLSMYRTMSILLGALVVVAFGAAAVSEQAFSVAELAASGAAILVSVVVFGRLFAGLFGVAPHTESSVITALILFFVLSPSTQWIVLLEVILAGLFATASKFLLAVRGRHIFNPAAVGAVWLAIFQRPIALWWVGSTTMLPFVAIAALLIVVRTRRFAVVGTFLVLAAGGLTIRTLQSQGFGHALWFSVAQTPIVFLAGFMLTEPLTLPPRRWQQLLTAAVIAGLIIAAPSFSKFAVGPETAILVGNAVAFLFGQRRAMTLRVAAISKSAAGAAEIVFHPERPLRYQPGQYLELVLPHRRPDSRGTRRIFSISSAPQDSEIRLGVKIPARPSTFKAALAGLKVGDSLRATTISGDFLLPTNRRTPVLMVAGGIGITPFLSQLAADVDGRDVILIWAVSEPPSASELRIIGNSAATIYVVGRAADGCEETPRLRTLPDRRVDRELIAELVGDITDRTVLVSGPPVLVDAVTIAARQLKASRVKTDYFAGY